MLAVNLNDNDKNLLKIIFKYGGYVRIKHIKILYPELADRTLQYRLDKLVKYGYLTKRRFTSASKKEPVTYQVTQAACIACGNPNSTYRRKRPLEYAVRALIKIIFCLEIHKKLESYIITDLNKRKKEFEKAGFITEYFPEKLNYSKSNKLSSIVQFEELNIDFRITEGKQIVNEGQILYTDSQKTMIIVHIDQTNVEIKKQLNTLANRYINMINQNINGTGFHINFLVVTYEKERKAMYESAINEIQSEYQYTEKISNSSLKIYKEFYEKLAKKDSTYSEQFQEVCSKYDSGKLKSEMIERAKHYNADISKLIYKEIEAGLKSDGIEFLLNKIYGAVRQQLSVENARIIVEEYFNLLFYFEIHNILKIDGIVKSSKYDIKVYLTGLDIKFI